MVRYFSKQAVGNNPKVDLRTDIKLLISQNQFYKFSLNFTVYWCIEDAYIAQEKSNLDPETILVQGWQHFSLITNRNDIIITIRFGSYLFDFWDG